MEKTVDEFEWVMIDRPMVLAQRSARGGWSRRQLAALGIGWPPPRGWLSDLEGEMIDRDVWEEFLRRPED